MKKYIRKLVNKLGLDLQKLSPSTNPIIQLNAALDIVDVDVVFDIGANAGQFASDLRSVGFLGYLVSFEPLSSARTKLVKLAEKDKKWSVHDQAAVGDFDGFIDINIAGNSVSSSVLPMLESHSSAAKGSAYVASETVPVIRLDSVADNYLRPESNLFIKIDTQGYEWQVLEGAAKTIKRARGVICELSLVPLYEGQRLWLEMIKRLELDGFTLWAIQRGFTDVRTGRSLQIDAIFLRLDKWK